MKTEALKPLGEEKPTVITDTHTDTETKMHDTLVEVPLPDSEPKTTKTGQPSAGSVQNTQDHKHCQFASTQATSPGPPSVHPQAQLES